MRGSPKPARVCKRSVGHVSVTGQGEVDPTDGFDLFSAADCAQRNPRPPPRASRAFLDRHAVLLNGFHVQFDAQSRSIGHNDTPILERDRFLQQVVFAEHVANDVAGKSKKGK